MAQLKRSKENLLRKIYFLPSKNTALVIPLVLILGFVAGLLIDTSVLKNYILIVTVLMIYPTMIGFKIREVFNFSQGKLMLTAIIINFTVIPLVAYLLGVGFLLNDPQLFAGLIITALLPTSNLTIAFTTMAKGNVPGAIKLTTVGLLLGALLAPLYLSLFLGKYLPINLFGTLKTISIVVLVPLAAGLITYKLLLAKYSIEKFQQKIKPYLPAASAWGMVFIVFTSVSMNASIMVSQLRNFLLALFIQFIFISINYVISIFVGKTFFEQESALSLVFGTALRNLSIAIGLAASSFGSNAALMVSLAFLIQPQAAAWFIKINRRFTLFPTKSKSINKKERINIGEV
jgi:predicted Na+-dependent transporter